MSGGLPRPTTTNPNCQGFTLIELVLVIVILAIVGTYASVKWQSGTATARFQAERLAEDIRYIQTLAMNWGQNLQLDVVTSTNYAIKCVNGTGSAPCVAAGNVITDPQTKQSFSYTLQDGVTLSGTDTNFDKLGRPCDGTCTSDELLNANRSFTLSGGGSNWTVAVAPVTGYVSVSGP